MSKHPLAEVFGFPADNISAEAERYRTNRLCPYNNKVPSCTKDKAKNPLGVCTVFDSDAVAITCPIRFRQDWLIVEDAARFLFPPGTSWTSLQEIRLNDANGQSAGNIDFVLVAYDDRGRITDFGALEVQGVYISGNVRQPFECYMADRLGCTEMSWTTTRVAPDYLSSSRKRLVPQLLYKGGILKAWGKKQAVVLHEGFYRMLPSLPTVDPGEADVAWLIYGLDLDTTSRRYRLVHRRTEYTALEPTIKKLLAVALGNAHEFSKFIEGEI
jgi:hypothetical protein